jgi:hypothetical protein
MIELASIAQAVAVVSACWAIISGVGAWKREFLGKRRIEVADQVLAKFFEVRDAMEFIRNPWSRVSEGQTRERSAGESRAEASALDRGYIVVERYTAKAAVFAEFEALKYRARAMFGAQAEEIFTGTFKALNSVVNAARQLGTHYWRVQGTEAVGDLKSHLA